ncbi:DUF6879 family protein [Dactylosporangium sp. NPDC048998]|uniref:DUF6879 family protein n=1 Tax=Dactylosporangium sp. NPDC048998 TaxID=3363976 RepID=UPI0037236E2C
MNSTSYEFLTDQFTSFQREAVHLEMRDAYGTAAELPHLRAWLADDPGGTEWLEPWFATVRTATRAGKTFRRARIVSEPLSDYQRWVRELTHLFVEAGEDTRWVPRRRVSTIALPGNDFWLFDDELVIFLIFAGNGLVVDRLATTDPDAIRLCRSAFDAVWDLAIPDRDYHAQ